MSPSAPGAAHVRRRPPTHVHVTDTRAAGKVSITVVPGAGLGQRWSPRWFVGRRLARVRGEFVTPSVFMIDQSERVTVSVADAGPPAGVPVAVTGDVVLVNVPGAAPRTRTMMVQDWPPASTLEVLENVRASIDAEHPTTGCQRAAGAPT